VASIVFYSMAHRGDVFPYVPVASELAARGHHVVYVTPREYHSVFHNEAFECRASGTDFSGVELDQRGAYIRRWGRRLGGGMVLRLYLGELMVPHLPVLYARIHEALAGADLLVSHPAASLVGRMAAEVRGVPWVVADLFPMLVPTGDHPPSGVPLPAGRTPRRRAVNRAAWRLGAANAATRWVTSERAFRSFRTELGLPTERGYALNGRLSPHHNVALVSPAYFPPPPDLPGNYTMVGFTHWSTPVGYQLADDVEEYLAAGEPPVLVTLGSSAAAAAPDVFDAAAEALDRLGRRGLFLVSNQANVASMGSRPGMWDFVPITPLLARCAAVVHSGAHGTNAIVMAAGLPAVIVPQLFDQVWHGRRVAALGTGRHVRRASPRALAAAVAEVTEEPSYRGRAVEFAARLAEEDGPRRAADQIEAVLSR
jgi:UDP:flavonoid glycosyltransferase YjiC (YdhE family)